MRSTPFLIATALLTLAACQTPEEKLSARIDKWAAACGYPVDANGKVHVSSAEEEAALGRCMHMHEDAYQADRARNVARGAALLGAGTTLMTTNPYAGAAPAAPRTCTTSQQGVYLDTTCF
jgi:hypothetical protein